jgi:ABC-type hemin transport system ATPase subunit
VLDRLAEVGFTTRAGGLAPFGEELPLVTGVAWETNTAQMAVVAELSADDSDEVWQQLLFAVSGLRHQLSSDGPTAYGTPLILAVVDEDGVRRLRGICEDLAERFAVFNRVDLNLVRLSALNDPDALDLALAPLLPRCRDLLGQEISRVDVEEFWKRLHHRVAETAMALDDVFGEHRQAAASTMADALIGDTARKPERPAPHPIGTLRLESFRSFAAAEVEFAPVTVLHGPNGGGKSSVVEALELMWAGRSQRLPSPGEETDKQFRKTEAAYERALVRDGATGFTVTGEGVTVSAITAEETAELRRSVLTQETVSRLVEDAPLARYRALLSTTGLELPDLDGRTRRILADAKAEADAALAAAGLPPLARANAAGLKHLRDNLTGGVGRGLPDAGELNALEATVADACHGGFERRRWNDEAAYLALARADGAIAGVLDGAPDASELDEALTAAAELVRGMARERVAAAARLRSLLDAVAQASHATRPPSAPEDGERQAEPTLPTRLAVRWMAHVRSLREAAEEYRGFGRDVPGPWADRLAAYAEALEAAADAAPVRELEREARAAQARIAEAPAAAAPQLEPLYRAAGFSGPVALDGQAGAAVGELHGAISRHADALLALGDTLERHPARRFAEHAPRVLRAVCRFELARALRGSGPVLRAADDLVGSLLQTRLAPVLQELVAAIVRFEWYFKPLQVLSVDRQIVLGGLATEQNDLDARLVLNAAERTVVGVAWFLALHLLQPPERRRVLVLDDPTGAFDAINQAGLLATLRAFVRLARPEQVVITTHDDALGAVLAEEFAPVDGWPSRVARLRVQRNEDDASVPSPEWSLDEQRWTAEEADALGLEGGGARLFA